MTAKVTKAAPKKPVITRKLLIVAVVALAVVAFTIGWLALSQHKYRTFNGKVTQIGLEGSAADAPVYYQVQVSAQKSEAVYLNLSPTPEHPTGTPLPQVKVGDKVSVHAKKGPKGTSLVGSGNTYIKRQE